MNQKKKYCKLYLFVLSFLIGVLACAQYGCKTEFDKYYEYPDNLAGPIYQQLAADTAFTEFVKAIDKLPTFKKAINTSGLYTAFIPSNAAIKKYLRTKYSKNSFDEFNMGLSSDSIAVQGFVDAHFVLDMYFAYNFNKAILDITGNYIIIGDGGDKFRYFLRYREPIYDYLDVNVNTIRKVRPENKMLSVYMDKYLKKYGMTSDYEALFGRAPGDFNVEGAHVLPDKRDIAAINGVIHGIDRVLEPKKNLVDIQKDINPMFDKMGAFNVQLYYDADATASEGTRGETLDSLFRRDAIFSQMYNYSDENRMFTFLNPPKEAYENYINQVVIPKYRNSIDSIHFLTKLYLTNNYMLNYAAWSSSMEHGVITPCYDTIVKPKYSSVTTASNGLIYNLSDLILPSAFNSVARGFMLNWEYSYFYDLAINFYATSTPSGTSTSYNNSIIQYLQDKNKRFTIFIPCNDALKDFEGYGVVRETVFKKSFNAYNYRRSDRRMASRQQDSIVNYMIIPDMVITPEDVVSATNKWYETRLGNYIQIKDGKLDGEIPLDTYEITDNGIIYYLSGSKTPIKPGGSIADIIKANFPNFYAIIKARSVEEDKNDVSDPKLADADNPKLESFLKSSSEMFTVFIPTDAALDAYKDTHGLGAYDSDKKWGQVIKYLMTKTRVYTDGTFKQDEASMNPYPEDNSKFVSVYKDVIYADPAGQDEYSFFKVSYPSGNMVVTSKDGETANVVSTLYKTRNVFDIEATNGVIHAIDKVLVPPTQSYPDKK